jgi:hypothetical protein
LQQVHFFSSEGHDIPNNAPCEGDDDHHEGSPRGDFVLPQPPQSYERCSDGEPRVEPESLHEVAVQQRKEHSLGAAEGAIEACEPVERAYQHVNSFDFRRFVVQNYKLFTIWPKSDP